MISEVLGSSFKFELSVSSNGAWTNAFSVHPPLDEYYIDRWYRKRNSFCCIYATIHTIIGSLIALKAEL